MVGATLGNRLAASENVKRFDPAIPCLDKDPKEKIHVSGRLLCKYLQQHYSEKPQAGDNLKVQPLVNEWLGKLWYIHVIEYYLAVKGKELEICTTI